MLLLLLLLGRFLFLTKQAAKSVDGVIYIGLLLLLWLRLLLVILLRLIRLLRGVGLLSLERSENSAKWILLSLLIATLSEDRGQSSGVRQ